MTGYSSLIDEQGKRYPICGRCNQIVKKIIKMEIGGELCPVCRIEAKLRYMSRRVRKQRLNGMSWNQIRKSPPGKYKEYYR